ncbi:MAG: PHP domain-containing protein [Spirochaetaceae bacterium]|jgi:predicted metal-dependent phosphoesterase TrpH|nr:PHP domain-containing protein [Spirochaetaceae bacterium]
MKNGGFIDLHTHSTASDGKFSPSELVSAAAKAGLSVLALTDQDTIDGLAEAAEASKKAGICFIPGVEMEIEWRSFEDFWAGGEFHLLALGLDKPSPDFLQEMAKLKEMRRVRNVQIIEKMKALGWNADYHELVRIAGCTSIGRPHLADYLVRLKIVRTVEQAFERYLGKGKGLYIPKGGTDFAYALRIVKESGALAVLAHPTSLQVSWGKLPALLSRLKNAGLDGIEAWHPVASAHTCTRLQALGQELGLYITAGSDFHGENRRGRFLGRTAGGGKIPISFLEAIPKLYKMNVAAPPCP